MISRQFPIKALVAFMAMLFALSPNNYAADIFVSVSSGSDAQAGSSTAPFKTLFRAKQAVRAIAKTAPITVWVKSGTYYFDSSLVFTPEDGGTAAAPITYRPFCGDKVVLSGGRKVTTAWTTSTGNIMVTTLDKNIKCDQLFLNGTRQVLARYPNFNASTAILNGYASDCIGSALVAKWADPLQGPGYVRGLHSNLWGGMSYKITAENGSAVTTQWVGDNNNEAGYGLHPTYRLVENIFEELDAAGEWYYNKTTGNLYFWPPSGTVMGTAVIELASLEEPIKFMGTSATAPVAYVTFNGFTITHAHRSLFTRTYERLLRGDWAIARSGAVFIQNSENITIKNCIFDNVGGNGVFISAYNKNDLIYNNQFISPGASGVAVVGLSSAVRCASFKNQAALTTLCDQAVGPKTEDYPRDISIDNNSITNVGRFEKQTAGVCLSMCMRVTVRHNTIDGSPRSGINRNDGCWGGHIIEFNDILNCVQETGDHGPFNGWGRDRYHALGGECGDGCKGADKRPYCELDAMTPVHIRNNRLQDAGGKGSYGIDLDDGCTNFQIYKNLCFGTGIKLREGFYRKVYNNVIVNQQMHCHAWFAQCRDTLLNNIIVNSSPYDFNGVTSASIASTQALLDKNLFWNNGGSVSYNPFSGQDANSKKNVDPLFNNTSAKDYSVKSGSPALALGFVNFPMDSFGQMKAPTEACSSATAVLAPRALSLQTNMDCLVKGASITTRYWLDHDANVSLSLCELNGRKIIRTALRFENAGAHEITWNESSMVASRLPRNCYMVIMEAEGQKEVRKIAVFK